jgi:hypothetical protein
VGNVYVELLDSALVVLAGLTEVLFEVGYCCVAQHGLHSPLSCVSLPSAAFRHVLLCWTFFCFLFYLINLFVMFRAEQTSPLDKFVFKNTWCFTYFYSAGD